MDFGIWSHSGKSLIEARIRCLDVRPVARETGGSLLRTTVAHASSLSLTGRLITRDELAQVATPAGTATHKTVPHIAVVEKLIEALSFRQIGVVREEYAVSS